jgi:hypothetical protein
MAAPTSLWYAVMCIRCLIVLSVLGGVTLEAATVSLCERSKGEEGSHKEIYGPEGRLMVLRISDDVAPASDCAIADLPVTAAAVRWFSLTDIPVKNVPPDRLGLQGFFDAPEARVSEVIHAQSETRSEPSPVPIATGLQAYLDAHPFGGAELPASAMPETAPARAAGYTSWFWAPSLWRASPETIWKIARTEDLRKIYVTIPVDGGRVLDEEQLAVFIGEALARGIDVWAVLGDPHDVLPENLPLLQQRTEAYRLFNSTHPDTRIAGVQLDIEPYLLPGSTLAPDYWRERYISTITAVHGNLSQQLPLDLVMPVWWGSHPAWGSRLLNALALPGVSITVMNYRTNVAALRAGAMPFLAWGQDHGRKVTMALEQGRAGVNAGNGRDETRLGYARADSGELWLMKLGGITLLVLLDEAYAGLPGQAYAQTDTRVISTGTVSFAGATDNLHAIAATLESEWLAWDSYAGLAIHGLDQADAQGR